MKPRVIGLFTMAATLVLSAVVLAQPTPMDTTFTYQGQIKQNGSPVNGTCDYQFALYNTASSGGQIGPTLTKTAIAVSNGLFAVSLDFGPAFQGDKIWLDIQARCPASSGSYVALSPRQQMTATPYALGLPGLYTEMNGESPNLIGGRFGNGVTPGVVGATIGGGGSPNGCGASPYTDPCLNRVTDSYGVVGGGLGNQAGDNAGLDDKKYTTVSGGGNNTASGYSATVGGGYRNTASHQNATVSGGVQNTASYDYATVGGGINNTASNGHATVSGGTNNTASGASATVPGGRDNSARGHYSFAAGYRAIVSDSAPGSFVWSDAKEFDTWSANPNEFVARATGGFWLISGIDATSGTTNAGVRLTAGSSSWSSISDRNAKTNVTPVDSREVVAKLSQIPLATWRYKSQAEGIRHMGPMAQDFYAAFGLGEDEKYISTIDADGVALAAIQGLYQELKDRDARIATLESRLTELEQALRQLAANAAEKR